MYGRDITHHLPVRHAEHVLLVGRLVGVERRRDAVVDEWQVTCNVFRRPVVKVEIQQPLVAT